jgi:hypothetical protein
MDNIALKRLASRIPQQVDEAFIDHSASVDGWAQALRLAFAVLAAAAAIWYWRAYPNQRAIYLALSALWIAVAILIEFRRRRGSVTALGTLADFTIVNLGLLLNVWKSDLRVPNSGMFLLYFPLLAMTAARYRPALTLIAGMYAIAFYIPTSFFGLGTPWFRAAVLGLMTFICAFVIRKPKKLATNIATRTIEEAYELGSRQSKSELNNLFHEALFPPSQLDLPSIWCSAKHSAGTETGGDYYYVFETDTTPIVIVGDLDGSDAGSLSDVTRLHQELSKITSGESSIKAIMEKLNSWLWKKYQGKRRFSCFVAQWMSDQLHYINAGHLPAIHLGRDSRSELPATAVAAGEQESALFEEKRIPFPARDLLLVYSDGLYSKLANNREQGIAEIEALAEKFRHGEVNTICHRVFDCAQPGLEAATDDATIVVVRRQP